MKIVIFSFLLIFLAGTTYCQIIPIDAKTWYEYRGVYAGQNEVKLHFVDSQGVQQDVLTCFPSKPTMSAVMIRLTDIRARFQPILAQPPIVIKLTDYTPAQIKAIFVGKVITAATTWSTILGISAEPIEEVIK
jgi:hypothetical protein